MPFKRRFSKRTRRPRRTSSTARRSVRPRRRFARKGRQFKSKGFSLIKVRTGGEMVSFSRWNRSLTPFGRKMAAKYFTGAKNYFQTTLTDQLNIPVNPSVGDCQDYGIFSLYNWNQINSCANAIGQAAVTASKPVNTARIYHHNVTGHITMTNSSSQPVLVSIYAFSQKYDASSSVIKLWQDGMSNESNSTSDYTHTYGVTPLMATNVNSYNKCMAIYKIAMSPGNVHRLSIDHHLGQIINNAIICPQDQLDSYFRHLTVQFLIVLEGTPVTDSATPQIGLAPANLDVVFNSVYSFKYVQDNDTNYANSLSAFGVGAVAYNIGGGGAQVPFAL